ncbi:hypothetical protein AVEN_83233-1 [Araneus ventricosus]|uniref:Uncharacterized protein n=1 Tax=Araneus ventricosus TaxID=182803 RepID=A0A4Y2WNR9_ARAVE|nr:hypothetical protein AVEN_7903-1 [Araneus ventricosus]GBO39153.1 hypothetical protein AVEN_83233-1 [Araneus ventricosus]
MVEFNGSEASKIICAISWHTATQRVNASLMSMLGSDVSIVRTSIQEKGESLMGQDRDCRPGDPPRRRMCSFVSLAVGGLHYRLRKKTSTQEPW